MTVDEFIRKEVKRQLRLKLLELGAPPPEEEQVDTAVHLDDALGSYSMLNFIAKLKAQYGLGLATTKYLEAVAKDYSRFWTDRDFGNLMNQALAEVDDDAKKEQVRQELMRWFRERPKHLLQESSFFERARGAVRLLKWWELLLLGLGAAAAGAAIYKIYEHAIERKNKGDVVRYLGPVRTPLPGRP